MRGRFLGQSRGGLRCRRPRARLLVTVSAIVAFLAASATFAAFAPPERITVVTDFDYPPYLFTSDDGQLKGIIRDKWQRWSEKTGIPVEVKGKTWIDAQQSVQQGIDDVIETLSYTPDRAGLYEYSQPYAPVEANVYFHRSISAISDAASMRGFTIGAKRGSACGNWLSERGIALREYPSSEALVHAAGSGEVRLFCMDSMTARYYLYKLQLADDFRASPPLYATKFHWAVKKGRTELLAFIQQGFDKFSPNELEDIDNRWVGNPIQFPLATRFLYYLAIVAEIALVLYLVLVIWNRMLRKRVAARTDELGSALGSLRQAVGAGNVGLFDWDLRTNHVRYSPEWKRQIGYDDAEISDAYSEWHDRIHPDDRERVLAVVRGCIDSPPHECRVQFRFRHKDGSYRWILAQAGAQSRCRTARCRGCWARTSTSPTRSATKRWWPARRTCTSSWPRALRSSSRSIRCCASSRRNRRACSARSCCSMPMARMCATLPRPACRSNFVARSTANRSAKAPDRAAPPCIDANR